MPVTIKDSSEAFSGGDVAAAFDHLSDNVEWEIMGRKSITGKAAFVAYCATLAEETCLAVLTKYQHLC